MGIEVDIPRPKFTSYSSSFDLHLIPVLVVDVVAQAVTSHKLCDQAKCWVLGPGTDPKIFFLKHSWPN